MITPDPTPVTDLIEAFRRSKTMFAAVSLRLFDRLHCRPATAAALSEELSLNQSALKRLLDGCVGLGLLRKSGGEYANTDVAEVYLRHESPRTLAGYILYSNRALYPMWANLEDAVREGTNRWRQTFGLEGNLFSHFFRTDEDMRAFLAGMHGFGLLSSPAVVKAFDLSSFRFLVDLGGATGHLAQAAKEAYPSLTAALFDLPPVIEVAKSYVTGIQLIPGDFFKDSLPQADLFALGRILHDWSEEKIDLLLRKIYDRLPVDGGLLIAEKLLEDDHSGPVSALMQSLNMLICTEGRERSLAEYTELLKRAGFGQVEGRKTNAPLDAILAIKTH